MVREEVVTLPSFPQPRTGALREASRVREMLIWVSIIKHTSRQPPPFPQLGAAGPFPQADVSFCPLLSFQVDKMNNRDLSLG